MKCSGYQKQPGRCDLCDGDVPVGGEHGIRDMVTNQSGHCCDDCLREKVWDLGPCCRKVLV